MEKGEYRTQLDSPEAQSYFPNMEYLDLLGNNLTALSPCIGEFRCLRRLVLDMCKQLKEIPELPPSLACLSGKDCESLEIIHTESLQRIRKIQIEFINCSKLGRDQIASKMLSEWLKTNQTRMNLLAQECLCHSKPRKECSWDYQFNDILPGGDIPGWFYRQGSVGRNPLCFRVHSMVSESLGGSALAAALCLENEHAYVRIHLSVSINGEAVDSPPTEIGYLMSDHIWISDLPFAKHLKEKMQCGWNQLEVSFVCGEKMKVKGCGAHFTSTSGGNKVKHSGAIRFLSPKRPMTIQEGGIGRFAFSTLDADNMELHEGLQMASGVVVTSVRNNI